MLHELHIESLGVIERLDLVLGAGLTALTGETGAGKTMLVEAISLLVGGRADAMMVRPGRRRGTGGGSLRGGRRRVRRGPRHPGRRPVAGVRERSAGHGRRTSPSSVSARVDLHGQHAHQSLLVTQPSSAMRSTASAAPTSRRCAAPGRGSPRSMPRWPRSGGDTRSRAREVDLLRFQVGRTARRGDRRTRRGRAAGRRATTCSPVRSSTGRSARRAVAALTDDGRRRRCAGRGAAQRRRAELRSPTPRRGCAALLAEVGDVAAELRVRAEAIDEDPERLDAGARAACSCCATCVASTATRWPR